ncbi:MAG: hypothetical protein OXI96_04010 [Acidimicrobiaceae bacterium]|nr:hypothetical protein [Acidimicrobiaceae bacterium]
MAMDEVQRAFYAVCFERDFHKKKGIEFEQWFVRLAGYAYGSDFESVAAVGPDGDFKADGRRVSTKTIYQCYAPQRLDIAKLTSKIDVDFHGAKQHWKDMREWVLVINAQQEPELGQEPVVPPSVDKLRKNELSSDVVELLRIGRRKEHLVGSYISGTVRTEIGERVAEAFRQRYADLKAQDHSPDVIFGHLQQYAGAAGTPERQAAGLAVLSYFFEHCDIFEDPADSEDVV